MGERARPSTSRQRRKHRAGRSNNTPANPAAINERVAAAKVLTDCLTAPYRSIDRLLAEAAATSTVRALVYSVLRRYCALEDELSRRLRRPIPEKHSQIKNLAIIGAYQMVYGGVPPHAAIHEAVAACQAIGRPWFKTLVNAVLRGLQRDSSAQSTLTERSFDLPYWLEDRLREAWGVRFEPIAEAFQYQPPMTLRINRSRIPEEDFRRRLTEAGIESSPAWEPETLVLAKPQSQTSLPGYLEGLASVQDAAAQFAARLLQPKESNRILDACAAPGGKLFHLMELNPLVEIHGVEVSARRADALREEAARLGFADRLVLYTADARTQGWWDGKPFDRILLDAPCTGTGTIRRRPDIKIHRAARDEIVASQLQLELLECLWPKLADGGRLLYCTCSILPAENQGVIERFLDHHPDAELEPIALPIGVALSSGWQLLPDHPLTDGFYYAALRRNKSADSSRGPTSMQI
jgi:16S rRNA (cytosine967-C5)-methyltransferase